MTFDLAFAITSLQASGAAIQSLAAYLLPSEAAWKPSPDRWSVLEVINHLADEEAEDFRARLEVIVHRPDQPFTPIDPAAWVSERAYSERDLGESLQRFAAERSRSLGWLKELDEESLGRAKDHPTMGPVTGRRMLASWVAHDLLHVKQITRLRYDRLAEQVAPLSLAYAGEWK